MTNGNYLNYEIDEFDPLEIAAIHQAGNTVFSVKEMLEEAEHKLRGVGKKALSQTAVVTAVPGQQIELL